MTNYIIDHDIDFFNEIKENKEKNLNNEKDNNLCLITNEVLDNTKIMLPCNHSFNYLPLYKEICKQKHNYNNLEIRKLRTYQIKCPYCRLVIDNLLPYLDIEGVESTRYVNSPSKYSFFPNNCEYVFKSGKNKGTQCGKGCIDLYCKKHLQSNTKLNEDNNVCEAILKSGKNKGKKCCNKIFENSGYCKRHFKMKK